MQTRLLTTLASILLVAAACGAPTALTPAPGAPPPGPIASAPNPTVTASPLHIPDSLPATAAPAAPATPPAPAPSTVAAATAPARPFASLAQFKARLKDATTGGDTEALWQTVVAAGQMPLIFDDTAVFLYRGAARSVAWAGDFTRWDFEPPLPGTRQGQTDIWMLAQEFPHDARLDYKILIDGSRQILDPLNPFTQLGGYGPNSVVRMPGYVYPAITLPRDAIPHGTLGEPLTIASASLGYDVRYQVYTPAGYATLRDLPAIYATDGQEYAHPEMGALPITLDNLLADGAIRPVIAVFIDPREPASGRNRREQELVTNDRFEAFLTQELVPAVDAAYRTARSPDARAILGTSLGGLHAAYAGLTRADTFGLIAIQSPYFRIRPSVIDGYAQRDRLPLKLFMNQGTFDFDVANTRRLRDTLQTRGYPLMYLETNDGHSWGNWRGLLDDMLVCFFGR